jgi:SAM-dependent methyltransferase
LNYFSSTYFSDKPFKTEMKTRVWNEDIQDTHFPADSFDVIVSSETMEHVRKPWDGFREIYRILKPGGIHCFTIPYYENRVTVARIDTSRSTDVDLLPRIYHQDPYRRADSLVYTDFGSDIFDSLTALGFRTTEHFVWDERADIRDDFRPMRVFLSEKVPSNSD